VLTYRAEVPVNGSGPDALTIIAFHLFDLGGALARVPSDVPRDFVIGKMLYEISFVHLLASLSYTATWIKPPNTH
jgi:hypothetical protein